MTIPQWKTVTRAITMIEEDAWVGIHYPDAIFEEDTGEWISDAEVAEVPSQPPSPPTPRRTR